MQVYQFSIPRFDNEGNSLSEQHREFQRYLVATFGGFTYVDGSGSWVDESEMFHECVRLYNVAVPANKIGRIADTHNRVFWAMFPDQIACYVAKIGTAEIVNRPKWPTYDEDGNATCSDPAGHQWPRDIEESDRCLCIHCGADGDA